MLITPQAIGSDAAIEADICIVGAGPAGITLAIDLARTGVQVALIESGDLAIDERAQNLGDAKVVETRHAPMNIATRRQWGGTSTIWGGRCVPLDEADFDTHPARRGSVWPISHAEMSRYIPKACAYAECGEPTFTVETAFGPTASAIVPGFRDGDITATSLERWSLPTNFGRLYEGEARGSSHLRVYLQMTCVDFDFDESGRITALAARSLDGVRLSVKAKHYVVAAGGLESTRLLLNLDRHHPGGIGNHSGHLGRYYMGHISGKIAELQFATEPRKTIFGFERDAEGIYCRRRFVASTQAQRQQGLLNCSMWLDNPRLPDAGHRNGILSMAYLALSMPVLSRYLAPEAIRRAAVEHPARSPLWRHLVNILRDLPATVGFIPTFIYRRYFAYRKVPGFFLFNRGNRYALHYHGEQAPNRESRVRLTESRDALGMRRLDIDLRYSSADIDNVIRTHQVFDKHLRSLGIGRLEYTEADLPAAIDRQAKDGYHQIGTTRMSAAPEEGVVDGNCRVHTVDNLYVLSSSVFPTSGQANPTLTVVALAVRLADHLRSRLAS